MKFLSFTHNGLSSFGVIDNQDILDLGAVNPDLIDLRDAIKKDRLNELAKQAQKLEPSFSINEIEFLPTIPNPEKIICIGVNYADRNAEYKDGSEAPKFPSLFMRTPDSFTTHEEPLWRPPESHQLDYEGEIVIIIGKPGRRISEENAYDHIAGLTIMNEGTLRDWVRHAKFNVTQGKNFVNSGSIGPWMVSSDEFTPEKYENMHITTKVNNEIRQDDTTANMMFPSASTSSVIVSQLLSTFKAGRCDCYRYAKWSWGTL